MTSRRAAIAMSGDELAGFITGERIVTCATNGVRGWPHVMPLWYVVRGQDLWAWTFAKSQKARNLQRDPRATLQIEAGDSYDQLRGAMLEARATIHRELETVTGLGIELLTHYAPRWRRPRNATARGRGPGPQAGRAAVHAGADRQLRSPQARLTLAPTWIGWRSMPDSIKALARLVAAAGVNVSPGQTVVLRATLGQEQLAREVVGASYELGAHYVDVAYGDPHVRKVRLTQAPEAALGQLPPWRRRFPLDVEQAGGAMISLSGPVAPHLLDDVDPGRIGRDQVAMPEPMEVIARQRMRWTIAPGPTAGWAKPRVR